MNNPDIKRVRTSVQLPQAFKAEQRMLPRLGIVADLDDETRQLLAGFGEFFGANVGARVVEQDYHQDSLYFILKGECQVFYMAEGSLDGHYLATVRAGEVIGEANLFYPDLATASVYISEECELWRIDKSQMAKFIIAYPEYGLAVVAQIIALLSSRMKKLNAKASSMLDYYSEQLTEREGE
jgi:CRP/FNR family transcriptional regulator, cyclic AMP receptor protein